MNSIANLNNRINKLFRNPNINFFIIMNIILLITCYTFISTPIKNTISIIISNPIVILFAIIAIIVIGYFDINIAVLLLILFFVALFGIQYSSDAAANTTLEHFENPKENSSIYKINNNLKVKADNDKKLDEKVDSIKEVVLSTINKFRNNTDNDYKKAILENKKSMYEQEKQNNSSRNIDDNTNSNTNTNTITNSKTKKDKFDDIPDNNYQKTKQSKNSNRKLHTKGSAKSSNSSKNNEIQTVQPRTFDPSNEEDTNLLITKEILQDMSNRIEYNYESNKYLKKYIKHRVEEIVDLNKLIEDE
jgi:Ca2+/Na+ antiporter